MIIYYLDASAWIKRYYSETGTDWIESLFAGNPPLACASLGLIEVLATLARKRKAQEIDTDQHTQKAMEVEQDWGQFIQIHLSSAVVERSIRVVKDYSLRGADTIHLASAIELREAIASSENQVVIVTSDTELVQGAQQGGFSVVNPEEEDRQNSASSSSSEQSESGTSQ